LAGISFNHSSFFPHNVQVFFFEKPYFSLHLWHIFFESKQTNKKELQTICSYHKSATWHWHVIWCDVMRGNDFLSVLSLLDINQNRPLWESWCWTTKHETSAYRPCGWIRWLSERECQVAVFLQWPMGRMYQRRGSSKPSSIRFWCIQYCLIRPSQWSNSNVFYWSLVVFKLFQHTRNCNLQPIEQCTRIYYTEKPSWTTAVNIHEIDTSDLKWPELRWCFTHAWTLPKDTMMTSASSHIDSPIG
jgi:hypothetical protein